MSLPDRIAQWLRDYLKAAGADGFVFGLSGGVDSATVAALAVRAVGADRVLAALMPCHSQPDDLRLARQVAETFGIPTVTVDLTPVYDALLAALPSSENALAPANIKPRLRMITLYYLAQSHNYLVLGSGNKSELNVGYFCYDQQTRALTTEGLKTYQELRPGDVVFSLDLRTKNVIACPVAEVYVFEYEGEMLAYGGGKGSSVDLMVTPNHRILVERQGQLEFRRADELPRRSTPLPLPRPWEGTSAPTPVFEFDNTGVGSNARCFSPMAMDEFLYILGLYLGDGYAQASPVLQTIKGTGRKRDPRTGRFVAGEAETTIVEYTGYRTWFALPDGSRGRSRLIAILERNGIEWGATPVEVWVCGRPFYRAMVECGSSAQEKRIPSWVMQYPSEYLTHLLEGLMDSDGDRRGYYYTSSPRLAEQVAELGCKIGRNVILRTRPPRMAIRQDGVPVRSGISYEVHIYGNGRRWLHGAKFRRVPYRGIVWCPDVPGTHNLLVERNGRFLFCGNTKYGDGGVDLLPLGGLYKTQVWELARELGVPQEVIDRPPTAGLWPGQTDEGEMGITYRELDRILAAMEAGDLFGLDPAAVEKVRGMMARSEHKRRMPPIFEP
ncbi:MAG: NAD(+) synthase [Thermoflexales bacterium]|nr:NAD(+) synthase [Thermoflexales bacterium]